MLYLREPKTKNLKLDTTTYAEYNLKIEMDKIYDGFTAAEKSAVATRILEGGVVAGCWPLSEAEANTLGGWYFGSRPELAYGGGWGVRPAIILK